MSDLNVETPEHWDHLALQSEQHDFDVVRQMHDHLIATCAPRQARLLLDLACGTGEVASAAAAAGWEKVIGCDFSETSLAVARRRCRLNAERVQFVRGDVHALPFQAATFDSVFCVRSWWVLPDRQRVCNEIARVLVSGGELAVQLWGTPRQNSMITLGAAAIGRHAVGARLPPGTTGPFQMTPELLFEELRSSGLLESGRASGECSLKVESLDEYWCHFRALAGTAYAIYSTLPAALQQEIDRDIERALLERRDKDGATWLGLTWWICNATLN